MSSGSQNQTVLQGCAAATLLRVDTAPQSFLYAFKPILLSMLEADCGGEVWS